MTKRNRQTARKLNKAEMLTLLCAGQKVQLPKSDALQSGTIKVFNSIKGGQKVSGVNTCSGQDRDKIFNSFGKTVKFDGVSMELDRKAGKRGAKYRTISFKSDDKSWLKPLK